MQKLKVNNKENGNKNDKMISLAKSWLNSIVLISKVLIDSNIIHNEFVSENNVLKEFNDIKEKIKNSNNQWKIRLYIKQCYRIAWSVEKQQKPESSES